MQVTETVSQGLQREFKIVIEANDLEERMTARLDRMSNQARLPGFRPGKVPKTLLRQRYGKALYGEVLEETVSTSSQAAIAERSLRLATQPRVEVKQFEEGQNLEYTLAFEVMPEFDPGDFAKMKIERLVAEPTDKEINDGVERLAKAQRIFGPGPDGHAAQEGDLLTVDFVGRLDGVEFEGGKAEGARMEIGQKQFIPGFEEQLVGAKKGETRTIKVTFPTDYGMRNLAGREAEFDITLKDMQVPEESKVDEDLAKRLGMDSLSDVKNAVKQQLEKDFQSISRQRLKRTVLDELSKMHAFDVPPGLVDAEFNAIWREVDGARKQGQIEPGDEGKSDEELQAQYRELAVRRVRLGIVLAEVGRRNNVAVSSEELERALTGQAMRYPGQEKQIYAYYRNNPQAVEQLRGPLLEDKVIDFIAEMAKVTSRTVTTEELMADPDGAVGSVAPDAESSKESKPKKAKAKKEE